MPPREDWQTDVILKINFRRFAETETKIYFALKLRIEVGNTPMKGYPMKWNVGRSIFGPADQANAVYFLLRVFRSNGRNDSMFPTSKMLDLVCCGFIQRILDGSYFVLTTLSKITAGHPQNNTHSNNSENVIRVLQNKEN